MCLVPVASGQLQASFSYDELHIVHRIKQAASSCWYPFVGQCSAVSIVETICLTAGANTLNVSPAPLQGTALKPKAAADIVEAVIGAALVCPNPKSPNQLMNTESAAQLLDALGVLPASLSEHDTVTVGSWQMGEPTAKEDEKARDDAAEEAQASGASALRAASWGCVGAQSPGMWLPCCAAILRLCGRSFASGKSALLGWVLGCQALGQTPILRN